MISVRSKGMISVWSKGMISLWHVCRPVRLDVLKCSVHGFLMYCNLLHRALVNSTVGAQHVSKIVSCLTSSLSSLYDPQRIVVASFFAEVRHFTGTAIYH